MLKNVVKKKRRALIKLRGDIVYTQKPKRMPITMLKILLKVMCFTLHKGSILHRSVLSGGIVHCQVMCGLPTPDKANKQ